MRISMLGGKCNIRITADTNIGVSRTDTLFMEGTVLCLRKSLSSRGNCNKHLLFNDKRQNGYFSQPARDYLMFIR
jgi:hypothetical protein